MNARLQEEGLLMWIRQNTLVVDESQAPPLKSAKTGTAGSQPAG